MLHFEQGAFHEAAALYQQALRIHRETGNRRSEGVALGLIGEYHMALDEYEPAKAHLEEALGIHREVGNRRFEAGALGTLGELLLRHGRPELGAQTLALGIRLLREVGDRLYVAKLLCSQGSADLARGDRSAARAALDEAEIINTELGAAPVSDLGRRIAALRGLWARCVP